MKFWWCRCALSEFYDMAKKSEILWTIVRRFSTIFEFFGWKRELYALWDGNPENQAPFGVSLVVTEL